MSKSWMLISLFLTVISGFSQHDSTTIKFDNQEINPIVIAEDDLSSYHSDEDYNYEIEKSDNSWWDGVKNWFYNLFRRFFEWLFGVDAAPNYLRVFFKYVPYLLLGLLLFLVIRFFIKANTTNIIFSKNNKGSVILSEEERIIKTEDIQGLIKQALEKNDYRLAIRYYYLYLLKLLTERELIAWELQKTNDDYLKELSQSKLKPLFEKVTLLYDYIWYGEFTIDHTGYEKAKANFEQLKNSIATDA